MISFWPPQDTSTPPPQITLITILEEYRHESHMQIHQYTILHIYIYIYIYSNGDLPFIVFTVMHLKHKSKEQEILEDFKAEMHNLFW